MPPLTREQSRRVDQIAIDECGMSGLVLMENAARGCVEIAAPLADGGPVTIVCGKGNNGGDGFAIARHLDNAGTRCRVVLTGDPDDLSDDAAANFQLLSWTDVNVVSLSDDPETIILPGSTLVIDALLGTGATGDPRPPLDDMIRRLNGGPWKTLAIDVPSGLDCDTGEAATPCVCADVTATFVASKIGFSERSAREVLGDVQVVDIGVPRGVFRRISGG